MDQIPTFTELFEIAPIVSIVLLIVGVGFYAGYKARGEAVQILKQWLDELKRK